MKIGEKVLSKLYTDKGVGIIVNFSDLFGEKFAEILFKDGSTINTNVNDLSSVNDPVQLLKSNSFDNAESFAAKNLMLKIEQNLSENKIVTSANFKIKPLPHQLLTVNFVINSFKQRCLIADEVGLGKTIEAALVYEEFKLRGIVRKILIVVPSGLVLQWQEELANKFNENFIVYTKAYIKTLKESYGEETNVWKLNDKIIASIDTIKYQKINDKISFEENKKREWHNKNVTEHIVEAEFDMAIIDEAHKLSKYEDGKETSRYKLGKILGENIPILLLLTATPHQGKPELFLNLLKLLDPILFTSYDSLNPELVKEVSVRNQKRAVVDFDGNRIFKRRITSLIEIKRDENINSKEIKLYNEITEYSAKYYNLYSHKKRSVYRLLVMLYQRIASSSSFAINSLMRRRLHILENEDFLIENINENEFDEESLLNFKPDDSLLEAEKIFLKECIKISQPIIENYADEKFKKLLEVIEETIRREEEPNLKFIIFTEFKATQSAIIKFLKRYGYSSAYINGDLSREEKIIQVAKFKEESQILVSTDAGGEGINLQFCYVMINFDLPWNPARLEQRIGRVDRIGQDKDVLIFNFHLKDTIEDKVRSILENKLEIIKYQFGEDKLSDVLTLLQEEFNFDKIYIDAVLKLEEKEDELNEKATQIFNRAQEILEKDDFMLPFTKFNENADELLNTDLNHFIKEFVLKMLRLKNIEISMYKDKQGVFRFRNPYSNLEQSVYRYITFEPDKALENDKYEMINIEHPLFENMKKEVNSDNFNGLTSALKVDIGKFEDISGYWFVYKLIVTDNIKKNQVKFISVFMEDEDFMNNRISKYLESNMIDNYSIINNFSNTIDITGLCHNAKKYAEDFAENFFENIKFDWINEISKYEEKLRDYFKFKENAIKKIQIDNIRTSKLKSLEKELEEKMLDLSKQKNIVPKLELYQIAYLEFV